MTKPFASSQDTERQRPQMVELAKNVFGYLSDFDPNTGLIVGERSCTVIDCRATPTLGREFISDIRQITDKPISHIFLTHYHAVRVFGAAAFDNPGIIASARTRSLIAERGQADLKSETGRFPRLFEGSEEIADLTWPTITFDEQLSMWSGDREIRLQWLGRGHTAGDSVCFLPQEGIVFTGDLVDFNSTSYAGDAYIRDWIATLGKLRQLSATTLIPGRGRAASGTREVNEAIDQTISFLRSLYVSVEAELIKGAPSLKSVFDVVYPFMQSRYGKWPLFDHCVTFDISRAYDEARGIVDPIVWTDARDKELWNQMHS